MPPRLTKELALLRSAYPNLRFEENGWWLWIPRYPLPPGWNRDATDVAVQVPSAYPSTPPYGIYVPTGLLFGVTRPNNYQEPAGNQPPFPGPWGILSWTPADAEWQVPTVDLIGRASLLSYIRGIAARFQEGA
jgi:hypothetical protein